MKKIKKGEIGYINYRLTIQTLKVLLGAAVIIGLFSAGLYFNGGDKNNYYTLAAILAVLPVAKIAVNMYMFLRYRKVSDKALFSQVKDLCDNDMLLSDMIVTGKEKIFEISLALVSDTGICCYTKNKATDAAVFTEAVTNFVRSCGYEVNVTLLKDFNRFKDRAAAASKTDINTERAKDIRHAFLIMSL